MTSVFIPALWIASGVCLFAGIHFVVTGLLLRREPVFLAFGILCLLVAALFPLSAEWYQASDVVAAGRIKRWQLTLACFIYPTLVWFIGCYTDQPRLARWVGGFAVPFAGLLFVNFDSPYGFLYATIALQSPLVLPWGETINFFRATTTSSAWFYYGSTVAVFVWALHRCWSVRGKGAHGPLWPFAVYVVIQFGAVVLVALIDNLHLRSLYTTELVAPVLVVLMGIFLSRELYRRSIALETSLTDLRAESTRRRAAEVKLRHMAYHDYLTDLPNRRQLRDSLKRTVAHARASRCHAALLLLDLDHFKTINDSLGHDLGDELLRQVSRRLQTALASHPEPIRLGGDEFAVLLRDLAEEGARAELDAVRFATTLIAAIAQPFVIGDHELVIGASIGVVLIVDGADDEASLMRHADMALYWAKSAGRGAVKVYAAQMQRDADERLRLERGLRLARERDEFELHFEPQLDVCDRVVGMEALLRWRPGQGQYVPPAQFIAVAEETGLIHPLGDYVLNRACAHISAWQQARLPLPARFSVNISPWQLAGPDFTRKVRQAIDTAAIDASCLTLEITESAFLNNWEDLAGKIRELSAIGVQFSIDDFGTGYASIAHLRRLPFHELKIDRSFIHGMNLAGDKLIEAIIAIARHLEMRVVAEGVETPAQRTALANMGCDVFQGYLFSQPLADAGFVEWLGQRQVAPAMATQ